jgi:putative transposase
LWNAYLPTSAMGIYFYLYRFMDIHSRKIVGWQVYQTKTASGPAR